MEILATDIDDDLRKLAFILEGFDYPAILLSNRYEILAVNNEYQNAFGKIDLSKSMHYCYNVSHGYQKPCDQEGESCPMKKVGSDGKKQNVVHIHRTQNGVEHIDVEIIPVQTEGSDKLYYIEIMKQIPLTSGAKSDQTMVGSSPAFVAMLERINKVSRSDASVLLLGDTGTGKELAAKAIHKSSVRRGKPLITLECSGLTDSLFESELFGYAKGAFTGASQSKKGLVELAHGGTLFLDEIADVPMSMQVKLLRLLENRTFRSVGSTEEKISDFRLICATHKSIHQLVKDERFRADLFHRINVFPIRLPSLGERLEDLPQIAKVLLQQLAPTKNYNISNTALLRIVENGLPGNIRQLRNILNRAIILATTKQLDEPLIIECLEADAEIHQRATATDKQPSQWVDLKTLEKQYIDDMYKAYQGDVPAMATVLGISARSLYRKLQETQQ